MATGTLALKILVVGAKLGRRAGPNSDGFRLTGSSSEHGTRVLRLPSVEAVNGQEMDTRGAKPVCRPAPARGAGTRAAGAGADTRYSFWTTSLPPQPRV